MPFFYVLLFFKAVPRNTKKPLRIENRDAHIGSCVTFATKSLVVKKYDKYHKDCEHTNVCFFCGLNTFSIL